MGLVLLLIVVTTLDLQVLGAAPPSKISVLQGGALLQATGQREPGNTLIPQEVEQPSERVGGGNVGLTTTQPWEIPAGSTLMTVHSSKVRYLTQAYYAWSVLRGKVYQKSRLLERRIVARGSDKFRETGVSELFRETRSNGMRYATTPTTDRVVRLSSRGHSNHLSPTPEAGGESDLIPTDTKAGVMIVTDRHRNTYTPFPLPRTPFQPSPADHIAMAPEVDPASTSSGESHAHLGGRSDDSKSSEEIEHDGSILSPPEMGASTRKHYTYPPGLGPNLRYLSFIIYDTTPAFNNSGQNRNQIEATSGKDATVWIALLSAACFLGGIFLATVVSYSIYRRKWIREHPLPSASGSDEHLFRAGGTNIDTGTALSFREQDPIRMTASELLTCPRTNLLENDFLSRNHYPSGIPRGSQIPLLHRQLSQDSRRDGPLCLLNGDYNSRGSSSSRSGSTGSSCSTCSTILTLDESLEYREDILSNSEGLLGGFSESPNPWERTSPRNAVRDQGIDLTRDRDRDHDTERNLNNNVDRECSDDPFDLSMDSGLSVHRPSSFDWISET